MANIPLSKKQKDFCIYYVETGNALDSYRRAGYKCSTVNSAGVSSHRLLKTPKIQEEIKRLQRPTEKARENAIMDAREVMEHFTAIARGEEKDQFGIEISASDRLKALGELAKRTVDLENRAAGKADNVVQIKLDWGLEDDTE